MIKKIESANLKSEICNKILRALPEWFGIESAIVDYVRDVETMDTWVYEADGEAVGFISINKHNPYTAEVHVTGILEKFHKQGIGKKLLAVAESSLFLEKYKFLTVKTLSEKRENEAYAKTRKFYLKVGFLPIEEFKTLWGEHNPCLMLIKNIEKSAVDETKTWNEFWQKFLQIDFHGENPERWTFRKKKADWLVKHTAAKNESRILDLGCGDGVLDIWLSRAGHVVTAVDRSSTVLDVARKEDDTKKVSFITAELPTVEFKKDSFDIVVMIETLGLMSKEEDSALIKKCYDWLGSKGKIVVDIPVEVPIENNWSKAFSYGTAKCFSKFVEKTRLQYIDFQFENNDGSTFGLYDPYDKQRYNGLGLCRYLYTKEELQQLLAKAGFQVTEIPHYYEKDYVSIMGEKI